jgi:hypothetical protein
MSGLPSLCRLYLFLVPSTEKCLSGNGMEPAAASSFLPPISFQVERRRGGGTTITFFQRHVSPCFLFLPRKHTKQQPKRVEMGFPCRLTRRYTVCQLGVPRVYSAHLSNREISRKKNMASQQRIVLLGSWDLKSICPRFLNGFSFLFSVERKTLRKLMEEANDYCR